MACRDVWNTWPSGLRSPQNPPASPSGFVVTGGPRAMYFTHHGKPWLKPITKHYFYDAIADCDVIWIHVGSSWKRDGNLPSPVGFRTYTLQRYLCTSEYAYNQIRKLHSAALHWLATHLSERWCRPCLTWTLSPFARWTNDHESVYFDGLPDVHTAVSEVSTLDSNPETCSNQEIFSIWFSVKIFSNCTMFVCAMCSRFISCSESQMKCVCVWVYTV